MHRGGEWANGYAVRHSPPKWEGCLVEWEPANACPPSSPKFIWAHDIMTCHTLVLHPSFCFSCSHIYWRCWRKKDTSTYLFWVSLWPHISARPQLSDGRRGRATHPSRAGPHLHSLDTPTRRLDKRLQRCFAERFTEAQKSSQAMRHFLAKHTSSSSASSRLRPAPTQQTEKNNFF